MLRLWAQHPTLRRAAVSQGLLSVAFSAFWSTLAVMLHASFGLGSAAAGALALQEPLVRLPRLWPGDWPTAADQSA